MKTAEQKTHEILAAYEAGTTTATEATAQLADLGIHPLHIEEMLATARGESDVQGDEE